MFFYFSKAHSGLCNCEKGKNRQRSHSRSAKFAEREWLRATKGIKRQALLEDNVNNIFERNLNSFLVLSCRTLRETSHYTSLGDLSSLRSVKMRQDDESRRLRQHLQQRDNADNQNAMNERADSITPQKSGDGIRPSPLLVYKESMLSEHEYLLAL